MTFCSLGFDALMFDAYFSPPYFLDSDAWRMAHFGVEGCLLVMPCAHVMPAEGRADARLLAVPDIVASSTLTTHRVPQEAMTPRQRRQQVLASLARAEIDSFVVDGVSPHLEPDRDWSDAWRSLVADVEAGRVDALGELVVRDGSHRALRLVERHVALAKRMRVPVLVAASPWLAPQWQLALEALAEEAGELWYWTRARADFVEQVITADADRRDGVESPGVIAVVGGHAFPSTRLSRLLRGSDVAVRGRLALGSTRGRGLNPFALASLEMHLEREGLASWREALLERPRLHQQMLDNRLRPQREAVVLSVR